MQCLRRCVAALLVTAATLVGVSAVALYLAPRWLNDPDPPEKAAAILVLGGDPTRALEAADLYRAGYAPKIYFSVGVDDPVTRRLARMGIFLPREEDIMQQVLTKAAVPEGVASLLGRDMVSTAQEARLAEERLAGIQGPLLVVTSPYHVHRARLTFRRYLPETRRVLVVGSHYETLPERWWKDQGTARNVVLELAKTVYFLAGGRFETPAAP